MKSIIGSLGIVICVGYAAFSYVHATANLYASTDAQAARMIWTAMTTSRDLPPIPTALRRQ